MSEWIDIYEKRPDYGHPVLVVANGVTQNVTMTLDGADDTPDLFEPYFFESDDNCKFFWHEATHWMPLPEPPK